MKAPRRSVIVTDSDFNGLLLICLFLVFVVAAVYFVSLFLSCLELCLAFSHF